MKRQSLFITAISIFVLFAASIIFFSRNSEKTLEKDADAVYENISVNVSLNNDGSVLYHYSHRLKLLTYYAFHRQFGESFIVYHPKYQKLKILRSETKMANGKMVKSPDNAFNEVLPAYADGSAYYNPLREMVVSHTALERNAIIYFEYTIETQNNFNPCFMLSEFLAKNAPIRSYDLIVTVPENRNIAYQVFNAQFEPKISYKQNKTVYQWHLKNLNQIYHEKNFKSVIPSISMYDADYNVLKYIEKLEQPIILNDSVMAYPRSIMKSSDDSLEKINRICKWVYGDLITLHIPDQMIGYTYRNPDMVWRSNSGTETEKTLLLYQILKNLDIQCWITALYPFNADTVKRALCDISELRVGFSENTNNYHFSMYRGTTDLMNNVVANYQVMTTKKIKIIKNIKGSCISTYNLYFNNQGIAGNGRIVVKGLANPYIKLKASKNIVSELINNIDIDKLKPDKVTITPDSTEIYFSVSNLAFSEKVADLLFLDIPSAKTGYNNWGMDYLDFDRKSTLNLPFNLYERTEINIQKDNKIVSENDSLLLSQNNELIKFYISFKQTDTSFHLIKELNVLNTVIQPDEYPEFRKGMLDYSHPKYQRLVFTKKEK